MGDGTHTSSFQVVALVLVLMVTVGARETVLVREQTEIRDEATWQRNTVGAGNSKGLQSSIES